MKIKELLFTGFYSGYSPVAPGTMGTLVGMAIYVLLAVIFGRENILWINLVLVALLAWPAIRLGDSGEEFFGVKDAQQVVLDEMMGYWITMLFLPFNWKLALAGFILFRFFDILKPPPARKLQDLKGGLGIMIDDYIAGLYGCILLNAGWYLLPRFGIVLF